jgi:hypothetical protein
MSCILYILKICHCNNPGFLILFLMENLKLSKNLPIMLNLKTLRRRLYTHG